MLVIMEIELHAHTHHSRGKKIPVEAFMSPTDLVMEAKRLRLDAVAITDHSTSGGWREALEAGKRQGVIVIPGIEIETDGGHLIGLNLNEHVPDNLSVEETADRIREQGGLSVAPHPYDLRGEGIRDSFVKADAVEIFDSINIDRISNEIAEKKARKAGKPMVVGSDAHSREMLGRSINRVDAHDLDSALMEIRAGRVRWTRSYVPMEIMVSWTRERMLHSYPDILEYISRNYSWPKSSISRYLLKRFVMSGHPGWVRFGSFSLWMARRYGQLRAFRM
jgi:predicted metal-dependent phosphoesterase TrpH